jgi:sugar O-acyltransferase (sialic acid O-acetyltransferase NeuD family)
VSKHLVIVGAGGHGRVCADTAEAAGFSIHGFADDNHELGDKINGHQCIANTFEDIKEHCQPGYRLFFVAIGDNNVRQEIYKMAIALGYDIPSIIHPTAVVSRHAKIGLGTVAMAGAVVNANATVGNGCILSSGSSIDYDCAIADGVQISPGVSIAGGVSIGAKSFIGTGANIIPGITVGEGCLVGAGAAVTKDIENGGRVAGVPARPIRQ